MSCGTLCGMLLKFEKNAPCFVKKMKISFLVASSALSLCTAFNVGRIPRASPAIISQIPRITKFQSMRSPSSSLFAKTDESRGAEEATDGSAGIRQLVGIKGELMILILSSI